MQRPNQAARDTDGPHTLAGQVTGSPSTSPDEIAAPTPELSLSTRTEMVEVAALVCEGSPRSKGEDNAHIRRLIEADGPTPPVLVHRPTMRIVDGFHRVAAAKAKGVKHIAAQMLDGSLDAAFILAVQANVTHGLPLPLADRRTAAMRILQTHHHWSDRAIAASTGLSAKTVRHLRRTTAESPQLNKRIGRDGRARPLDALAGRKLAAEFIAAHPDATLRQIATAAGISSGTASDVRARLRGGQEPAGGARDERHHPRGTVSDGGDTGASIPPDRFSERRVERQLHENLKLVPAAGQQRSVDTSHLLHILTRDPALRMNATGRELLRWLHSHTINATDRTAIIESTPEHCVNHLIELASRCAAEWTLIAEELSRRPEHRTAK